MDLIVALRRSVPIVIGTVVLVLLFTLPDERDRLTAPASALDADDRAGAPGSAAVDDIVVEPVPDNILEPRVPTAAPPQATVAADADVDLPAGIEPASAPATCEGDPAWFGSPYLGHTGSSDGLGSDVDGDRTPELELERTMGLRWTVLHVHWAAVEPNGPTDPAEDPDGTWARLDAAVVQLHELGLNPLIEIAIGGNAGGPPEWAGRRDDTSAAPREMGALVDFVGDLVERYRPCGGLATAQGWDDGFGVRAWEIENEPDSYQTNWSSTADDFAEYATLAAARIESIDERALVVGPATADGAACDGRFLDEILDPAIGDASPEFRERGTRYAAGGAFDVVSFHIYELLSQAVPVFACGDDTIEKQIARYRAVFARHSDHPGFEYAPKRRFWHTEGGLDFGTFDAPRSGYKANWVLQFFGRAFTSGMEKVTVMDAHTDPLEATAVAVMTKLVPDVSTMREATSDLDVDPTAATVYEVAGATGATTYLAHAANRSTGTTIDLPVETGAAFLVRRNGDVERLAVSRGRVTVTLPGGVPYAEPLFVVDGRLP